MQGDFKYKTNWCVITGAPSSGKTSVIQELDHRGFKVQHEVAREVIENDISHGRSLAEIRQDIKGLQDNILETGHEQETELDVKATVFLDRGLPDSISYLRLAKLDDSKARAASLIYHYRAVFIFDMVPFVEDGIRTEDAAAAAALDRQLEADYRSLGYAPIRVPVMDVVKRADFLVENLIKT